MFGFLVKWFNLSLMYNKLAHTALLISEATYSFLLFLVLNFPLYNYDDVFLSLENFRIIFELFLMKALRA